MIESRCSMRTRTTDRLKGLLPGFDRTSLCISLVFSLLFALAVYETNMLLPIFNGQKSWNTALGFSGKFFLLAVLSFCGAMLVCFICCYFLSRQSGYVALPRASGFKKVFYLSLSACLLCWSICWLTYFPGTGMNDQVWIATSNGFFDYRTVHPIIFILLFKGPLVLSEKLFGTAMPGYAFYTFAQMLLLAVTTAYLAAWLYTKGVRKGLIYILCAYFALTPIIADYSITAVKDIPFTAFLLLLVRCTYDIAVTKGEWLRNVRHSMLFMASMYGITVIRNNGIYIAIALAVVLFFYVKTYRKIIVSFLAVTACSFILLNSVSDNYPSESYAVMIQQVGAVITYGGDVNNEQLEVLNEIMPIDKWREVYDYRFVDTVKWSDEFNKFWFYDNSGRFFRVWLELLPKNIGIYCRSYLLLSYGCWDTDITYDSSPFEPLQSKFFKLINNMEDLDYKYEAIGIKNIQVFPDTVQSKLDTFFRHTVGYFGTGTCLWILLLISTLAICRKNYALLIATLPTFINWLTLMIAVSSSLIFRYSFPFVISLPVYIILLISPIKIPENI